MATVLVSGNLKLKYFSIFHSFPGAQLVKNLPIMLETWVQSLDWEEPLEEGMATHSSILSWKIAMDRGSGWATVHGITKSQTQLSE